jgi:hypothetical protein
MGAKQGRLESRITLASSWTATFTNVADGAAAVDVPAGNYYLVDLIAAIDADISANWTISVSDGEGASTGKCTINSTSTPWSITWTSTDMRNHLGFTGNISGVSAAQTGTNHCGGLWLPDIPKFSMYGDSANGSLISDFRATKSPTGVVRAFFGNSYRVHSGIRWEGIISNRAMAHQEVVTNESFETFMLDAMTGRKSYIPVATYVRLYWDADVDGTYAVGRVDWNSRYDLRKLVETWNGRYIVDLPDLIVEGS